MGYDITFHPVKPGEIQHYVFDVIEKPELGFERAKEITTDPLKQRVIEQIYDQFPDWFSELEMGKKLRLESTFAYATACVCGFLHPYWYARNSAITMLNDSDLKKLLVSINQFEYTPEAIKKIKPEIGLTENYTGSGFIADISSLERQLISLGTNQNKGKIELFEVFDEVSLASLREAIDYCKQHGCGLMEASDVFVPIADESFTDPDNMRESEGFDEPVKGKRQWYQTPQIRRDSIIDLYRQSSEICMNDRVRVKIFPFRSKAATVVPLYMEPNPKHPNMGDRGYIGIRYDNGEITSVRKRRVSLVARGETHSDYWKSIFLFEKEYFEKWADESIRLEIQQANLFRSDIPERALDAGLRMAYAGQPELAKAYYKQAREGAEILLTGSLLDKEEDKCPSNLAKVLRAKALASASLSGSWMPELLVEACEHHFEYAKSLKRADWYDIPQSDYAEFVLTAVVSGSGDCVEKLLSLNRPFDRHEELIEIYSRVASLNGQLPPSSLVEQCGRLMEVVRHPNGGRFIQFGPLTRLLFAQMINLYLTPDTEILDLHSLIEWISR